MRGYIKKPPLSWIDANTVGLVATDTVPIWLTIGERTGKLTGTMRANIGASGLGGMASGTVAANTAYYVYAVLSGGVPYLIIDATPPTQGPSGYGTWTYLGAICTLPGSATLPEFTITSGTFYSEAPMGTATHTGDTSYSAERVESLPSTITALYMEVYSGGTEVASGLCIVSPTGTSAFGPVSTRTAVNDQTNSEYAWMPMFTEKTVYLKTTVAAASVNIEVYGWHEDPELYP